MRKVQDPNRGERQFFTARFVQTNPPGRECFGFAAAAPSEDGRDRLITHIVTLALSPRPVKDAPNFGEMLDPLTTGAVLCIHFHFNFDLVFLVASAEPHTGVDRL